MQRILAVVLIVLGLIGLGLGRLGETVWAPATEATATVDLSDPGPAVIIDPGVLYVGGMDGELVIEGASDVSVITAPTADMDAYLGETKHTRVTGASDWSTLSTETVNPDGPTELVEPTTSDLWRGVDTQPSPYTLDIAEFAAGEHDANEQPYRALMIVTDGTAPGAESVSITWPVEAENTWVPFAYAAGAALAVIGLVLLVVSLSGPRRPDVERPRRAEAVAPAATAAADPREEPTEVLGAVGADPAVDPDRDRGPAGGDPR